MDGVVTTRLRTPPRIDADDASSLRAAADEDGAAWLPGLVPVEHVAALAELVGGWVRELGWVDPSGRPVVPTPAYDDPDFVLLQQWAVQSEPFAALRHDRALRRVIETLVGGEVQSGQGDLVRVMCPGDPPDGTPPHQDAFYVRSVPLLWTAWIPLVDTPLELGPIAVWRGSHRLGTLPHRGEGVDTQGAELPPDVVWTGAALRPGDVVLFEGRAVHRTLPHRLDGVLRL